MIGFLMAGGFYLRLFYLFGNSINNCIFVLKFISNFFSALPAQRHIGRVVQR